MKWFKKIFASFAKWFSSEYQYIETIEFPEHFSERKIYLVGEIDTPWLIAFKCPCGCNSIIQLNLLKDANPRWKFKISHKNKIIISPSIWRNTGCKSHFYINNSKVDWV